MREKREDLYSRWKNNPRNHSFEIEHKKFLNIVNKYKQNSNQTFTSNNSHTLSMTPGRHGILQINF